MLKDIIGGFVALFRVSGNDSTEDRRKVIRLRCRFAVYCIDLKEITPATVVDMGLQGLRLECAKGLKKEARVSLVYRGAVGERGAVSLAQLEQNRQAAIESGVRCKVSWSRKEKHLKTYQVGLTYADSPERMSRSWVKRILKEIGLDEKSIFQRRKIVRVISCIPCRIGRHANTQRGRVVNMGAGGALLQTEEPFEKGSLLELDIGPYGDYPHLVCWGEVKTKRYDPTTTSFLQGVKFRELDEEQLDLLGRYVVSLLKEQTRA